MQLAFVLGVGLQGLNKWEEMSFRELFRLLLCSAKSLEYLLPFGKTISGGRCQDLSKLLWQSKEEEGNRLTANI